MLHLSCFRRGDTPVDGFVKEPIARSHDAEFALRQPRRILFRLVP